MPVETQLKALRQALDGENRRAMRAEERVQELTDLAAQLRRRLALTHAEERVRELEALLAQLRRRPVWSVQVER